MRVPPRSRASFPAWRSDVRADPLLVSIDHAGIRIRDKNRSAQFYARLGFEVVLDDAPARCLELGNSAGVRIHLIWNAPPDDPAFNVLMDDAVKRTGITHVAFTVDDLDALVRLLARESIAITEGPKQDHRRRYCFCRDPDGTVLEFSELSGPD